MRRVLQRRDATSPPWRSKPVVLSLFDGIGAAFVALRKLGCEPATYFSCEIDQTATTVLDNYPPAKGILHQLGDVRLLDPARDLARWVPAEGQEPGIDLLIGGSPCQDLSRLGKGRGLVDGEQSSLFFEYLRILRTCKPRYFFLENVLMSSENSDMIDAELGVTGYAHMCGRSNDSRFNVLWYPSGRRRTFHALEVERLMGFPGKWLALLWTARRRISAELQKDFYTDGVESRSQRWGHLGNSFSVYAVSHILSSVFKGPLVAEDLRWISPDGTKAQNALGDLGLTQNTGSTNSAVSTVIVPPVLPVVSLTLGERLKCHRLVRAYSRAVDDFNPRPATMQRENRGSVSAGDASRQDSPLQIVDGKIDAITPSDGYKTMAACLGELKAAAITQFNMYKLRNKKRALTQFLETLDEIEVDDSDIWLREGVSKSCSNLIYRE
ncbi:hypothetical protein HKX48_005159 [Thoreauomyces humboldtii]|nr:hypothetical protein HKX48_005159 [Thoreauomyces humboldtii]